MNQSGSLLAGRYRLSSRLATGGMGEVWIATDELLDRQVAAKLVKPEYAGDPVFRQRLHAEAKAAAAVRNPHVVDVFDVGEDTNADGEPVSFVIMELLQGQSISAVMADRPMSAADTADLLAQVGDALATAHAGGVVHRDIKPANLMREPSGHITVLDFGIARAADASALTATGTMLGTARYMSPEQVHGQPATAASDVYSLGVVAYHCLAGKPPFDAGSDIATAIAHRDQPPPPLPPTVPVELATLVEQCLVKQPSERPTATELARLASSLSAARPAVAATAVMPIVADAPTKSLPVQAAPADRSEWLEWRRIGVLAGAGVLLLAILAVTGVLADGNGPAAASSGSGKQSSARIAAAADHPSTVRIRPGRYVGESYATARRQLLQLGLAPQPSGAAGSPTATVTAISPIGQVKLGHTVTLTVLPAVVGPPAHAKPKPPHAPPGHKAKPVPPGHAKHGKDWHHGPGGEGGD
jgi:serine/threonine-protein kinase